MVKMKSYLMERFFDESDDALHKRLPRDPFTEEASPPCPSTPCPYALQPTAAAQSTPTPFSLPQHPPPWFSESPSRTPLARIQLGGRSPCKASDQVALCTPPQCSRSHPQTDQATHRRTPLPPLASPTCWWPQRSTADLPFHPSMCSSGIFSCSQIISAFGLNGYISTFKVFCSSYIYSYQNQIDLFSFLERKFNINRNTI